MNRIATVAAALLLAGCGAQSAAPELLPAENFAASIDGKQVNLYTLHAGDITLQATNYGARVVSLWTPTARAAVKTSYWDTRRSTAT